MRKPYLPVAYGLIMAHCLTQGLAQVPATLKTIQPKVDSLTAQLTHVHGKERYVVLRDIAYEYYDIDNERGLEFIKQANTLAIQLGDSMDIVHSTRMLGQLLRRTGRSREGIRTLLTAFDLAKKIQFEKEELRIAGSLGVAYLDASRFDSSLRYTYHALRARMKRGEQSESAVLWTNIGLLYYMLGHYEDALGHYLKARQTYLLLGDRAQPSLLLTNIALCQMHIGQYPEARQYLDEWRGYCSGGDCGSLDSLYWVFGEGLLQLCGGNIPKAKPWFYEAIKRAERIGDGRLAAEAHTCLGESLINENKLDQAKASLEASETIAIRGGYDFLYVDILNDLIEIAKAQGDIGSLNELQGRLIETTNRVFNQKVLNAVAVTRVEFEEFENQQLIEKQALILGLNEEAIQRHRWLVLLSSSLAVVLLMFTIVLVRFNRFQKRISQDLDRRVFDRTRELEASEKALVVTISEQKALMEMVSGKILSSIATLRGLWMVRGYGSVEPGTVDFDRAATDLLQVPRIIKRSIGGRADNVQAHINH